MRQSLHYDDTAMLHDCIDAHESVLEGVMTNEENDYQDLEIGPMLRRLRGQTSLREVQRLCGITNSYLSQIEKGKARPGSDVLKRLANLYGVPFRDLMLRAGHLDDEVEPQGDETEDVERAYQFVISDPVFRVGTRPRGPLSVESKRFIVELYQRYSGKRLL